MMLKKLLANKKIVILIILLLVLCVGVIIFVATKSKQIGGKDDGVQTEQSDEDGDFEDEHKNGSSGLEVLEPNEVNPKDSSDASGSWKDSKESDALNENSGSVGKKDDTNQTEEQTPNKTPNEEEKEEERNILIDDTIWGDIY